MAVWVRIVVGILLVAHGLVHLLYLVPDLTQFSLERSWLVPEAVARSVGTVLMWATVVAFGLLGLAVWGVPGLTGAWPWIAIVASALSLALIVAYWNGSLFIGILIDLAIIAGAVLRPEWADPNGS